MDRNSRIYVAGHSGLVGSAILRRLQAEGYDNLLLRTHRELDLRNQRDVEEFFERERPEYVFLAAAKVGGILANNTFPAQFIYDNLVIEAHVINSAHMAGVNKLLFLGSSCIYPKLSPQPIKEEYLLSGKLEPTNEAYAIAKIAGIAMCQAYNRQYGTNFISVMPTNIYGPQDNFDLLTSHVVPALIRKMHLARCIQNGDIQAIRRDLRRYPIPGSETALLTDEEISTLLARHGIRRDFSSDSEGSTIVELWGTGSPRREFLHVDDLADACLFLMKHYDRSEVINVGTGEDITIKELAEMVKEIIGYEGEVRWDTAKPDGALRKVLDVSKLRALGVTPRISLREGIKMTCHWYQRHLDSPASTG